MIFFYIYKQIAQMILSAGQKHYKFKQYQILIFPQTDRCVRIHILDPSSTIEYSDEVTLENIKTSALIEALSNKSCQIKFDLNLIPEKGARIDVLVASRFLKPIKETIMIEKERKVSERQILHNKISNLKASLQKIKEVEGALCNNPKNEEQNFIWDEVSDIMQIERIKLKGKGKYLLTISFFRKCIEGGDEIWSYFSINDEALIPSKQSGFYDISNQYIAHNIKKIYEAKEDEEQVVFTTQSTDTYPFFIKNFVVTAQQLS